MKYSSAVRKTLIYSCVVGVLLALYLGAIMVVTRIFTGITGSKTILSSAVIAAAMSFAFQPLWRRVQALIDSKFFRHDVDREEKLYELSREVITHTTTDGMAKALVRVITETLHPKAGALYLRAPDRSGFVRTAGPAPAFLPERMEENNALTVYFRLHPQPFVRDVNAEEGHSLGTRSAEKREDVA